MSSEEHIPDDQLLRELLAWLKVNQSGRTFGDHHGRVHEFDDYIGALQRVVEGLDES